MGLVKYFGAADRCGCYFHPLLRRPHFGWFGLHGGWAVVTTLVFASASYGNTGGLLVVVDVSNENVGTDEARAERCGEISGVHRMATMVLVFSSASLLVFIPPRTWRTWWTQRFSARSSTGAARTLASLALTTASPPAVSRMHLSLAQLAPRVIRQWRITASRVARQLLVQLAQEQLLELRLPGQGALAKALRLIVPELMASGVVWHWYSQRSHLPSSPL